VPTHNSAKTVQHVLRSILELEWPKDRLELIFVDDSNDETPHLIEKFILYYKSLFHDIKLIKLSHRCGVSRARNIGITSSSGEYIFFLDSDVVLKKRTLLNLFQVLNSFRNCGAVSALYIREQPSLAEKLVASRYAGVIKEGPLATGATLIPRHVIEQVGLFNEKLGYPYTVYEDWEYQVRIQRLGLKTLVDGREPLLHLQKITVVNGHRDSSLKRKYKHIRNKIKIVSKVIMNYFSFQKAYALYEVLKHAPWRLRLEYIFYALVDFMILALLIFNPVMAFMLGLAILILASCYYVVDMRNTKIRYAILYAISALMTRTIRALILTIYLTYRLLSSTLNIEKR
jgi:glycosyltransferase involved in cell wall biosynthesis